MFFGEQIVGIQRCLCDGDPPRYQAAGVERSGVPPQCRSQHRNTGATELTNSSDGSRPPPLSPRSQSHTRVKVIGLMHMDDRRSICSAGECKCTSLFLGSPSLSFLPQLCQTLHGISSTCWSQSGDLCKTIAQVPSRTLCSATADSQTFLPHEAHFVFLCADIWESSRQHSLTLGLLNAAAHCYVVGAQMLFSGDAVLHTYSWQLPSPPSIRSVCH